MALERLNRMHTELNVKLMFYSGPHYKISLASRLLCGVSPPSHNRQLSTGLQTISGETPVVMIAVMHSQGTKARRLGRPGRGQKAPLLDSMSQW